MNEVLHFDLKAVSINILLQAVITKHNILGDDDDLLLIQSFK